MDWWSALNLAQKIFFCIATPASVLLVVQIILMIVGFGSGGADADASDIDVDTDIDVPDDADVPQGEALDTDSSFGLFTFRGLIAFFAVGGWVGYTLADGDVVLAVFVAVIAGMAALVAMGFILKWLMSLQSNGNIRYSDAIGLVGEVYLTIPPKDKGRGKINVLLDERLVELTATQLGDAPIPTGKKIRILSQTADTFVVELAEQ